MRGKIKRIIIEDFITYEYVEIDPGEKMNMIVGPNGSGKSSILCAICLGLAGKPKSIGRITKLGDYVKSGCNKAIIRIELDDGGRSTLVTRIITSEGGSTWSLNGKTASQKQIEEMTSNMSIHMDNLCQFLSQERVQDFSKMNAKELLLNTQRTVGSQEMSNYHAQLIEMCKRSTQYDKGINALKSSLEKEIQKSENLKSKVESMKERLGIVDTIKNLKLKRPWVLYEEHLQKLEEVKGDYKLAVDGLKEKRKIYSPLEKSIEAIKRRMTTLSTTLKSKRVPGQSLQNALEVQDQLMQKMVENQRHLLEQEKAEETRRTNLQISESRLVQWDAQYKKFVSTFNEAENNSQMKEATRELQKVENLLQQVLQAIRLKTSEISEYNRELEELKMEKDELNSLENLKWETLKRNDTDAYRASKWIADNRQNFSGMVYQSLMLEIKMTRSPNDGRYLEMLIPRQDKKALLCEKSEEMKLLVNQIKNDLKARVNILQAPNESPNMQRVSQTDLKKCGFEAYVSDLFSCPLPILNYLCRSKGIHQVPVASTEKQVNMNLAKTKYNRFFAGDCLFSIKKSKYSGLQSVRTIPLTVHNSFHSEADASAMDRITTREKELNNLKKIAQKDVHELQEQQKSFEVKKEEINKKRTELKKAVSHMSTLNADKAKILARIETYKNQKGDLDEARKKCQNENKSLVLESVQELSKLAAMLKEAQDLDVQLEMLAVEDHALRNLLLTKEQELRDMKNGLKELEKQTEDLKKRYEDGRKHGQRLLRDAKEATGTAPGELQFESLQEIFGELPSTTNEIDMAIKDNEGRLEFCGPDTNPNILLEYEQQVQKVESIEADLTNTQTDHENMKKDMDRVRECWLPKIQELAVNISEKFGRLFEYMNCVGEVDLVEGASNVPNDYENYGLQIKVKFRSEEPLRDLCGAQSGGERSVSTAIYLLALQELTNVPFRCMDEINQGMDPTNERRIMNLMMKMSEMSDSCQYFVVTPKLLERLIYANSGVVMVVCQPTRFDNTKWKMQNFIKVGQRNRARKDGVSTPKKRKRND